MVFVAFTEFLAGVTERWLRVFDQSVGNVPYNMSEDALIDVFKRVGQVVGFRYVIYTVSVDPLPHGVFAALLEFYDVLYLVPFLKIPLIRSILDWFLTARQVNHGDMVFVNLQVCRTVILVCLFSLHLPP